MSTGVAGRVVEYRELPGVARLEPQLAGDGAAYGLDEPLPRAHEGARKGPPAVLVRQEQHAQLGVSLLVETDRQERHVNGQ